MTPEEDEAIQARARELAEMRKILDYRRNRPVVPDNKGIVARHTVAKHPLLLANGGVKNTEKANNGNKKLGKHRRKNT